MPCVLWVEKIEEVYKIAQAIKPKRKTMGYIVLNQERGLFQKSYKAER